MQNIPPVSVLFIVFCICIATAGCISDERYPATDILVSKYDNGGEKTWSTAIDSGKDDYATAVIETADGGYAVAGWVAGNPEAPHIPRVIRLDRSGTVLWDRTLGDSQARKLAIAEAPDGGFVIAQSLNENDNGRIVKITKAGDILWNVTMDVVFRDIVRAGDDRFLLAGNRTVFIDGNGTVVQDLAVSSMADLPSADGGFYLGRIGVPYYTIASVISLDDNGTVAWNTRVGDSTSGTISSMSETSAGDLEVLYTYRTPSWSNDGVPFMESEILTLTSEGNISERGIVAAIDPVCRTPDGGFAFLAYPFRDSAGYSNVLGDSPLSMVILSPEGNVIHEKALGISTWVAPQKILRTSDGGYLTLIVTGT